MDVEVEVARIKRDWHSLLGLLFRLSVMPRSRGFLAESNSGERIHSRSPDGSMGTFTWDPFRVDARLASGTVVELTSTLRCGTKTEADTRLGEIMRRLSLLYTRPQERLRPMPGDLPGSFDTWFDGGAARVIQGRTEVTFRDGAMAEVMGRDLPAPIQLELYDGVRARLDWRRAG